MSSNFGDEEWSSNSADAHSAQADLVWRPSSSGRTNGKQRFMHCRAEVSTVHGTCLPLDTVDGSSGSVSYPHGCNHSKTGK
jgi:hypothetical protein